MFCRVRGVRVTLSSGEEVNHYKRRVKSILLPLSVNRRVFDGALQWTETKSGPAGTFSRSEVKGLENINKNSVVVTHTMAARIQT